MTVFLSKHYYLTLISSSPLGNLSTDAQPSADLGSFGS